MRRKMIAFNELLENIDKYKDIYKKFGLQYDFDKLEEMQKHSKDVQMESENLRAECNKMCNQFAQEKEKNHIDRELFKKILEFDKRANFLNNQMNNDLKIINKTLKKLRNIPDEFLNENVCIASVGQIEKDRVNENQYNFFEEMKKKLNNYEVINFKEKSRAFLKCKKNFLYNETNVNQIVVCEDEIIFLTTEYNIDNLLNYILDELKINCKILFKVKSIKTNKSSSSEFYGKTFDNKEIIVKLKREFFTREFGIKYKNQKIDVTKFVNQINIKIKNN